MNTQTALNSFTYLELQGNQARTVIRSSDTSNLGPSVLMAINIPDMFSSTLEKCIFINDTHMPEKWQYLMPIGLSSMTSIF